MKNVNQETVLILSDIHLKHERAQKIINNVGTDKIIFLGDCFDNFYDNVNENQQTAIWFKKQLNNPKFIAIRSNHSISYEYPNNIFTECSGFTLEKSKAINEILTREDWDKQVWFYYCQGYLFSHAGVNKTFLPPDVRGKRKLLEFLSNEAKKAYEALKAGKSHWFYRAGYCRGGDMPVGGLTWQDQREFKPISFINQCVGHTPLPEPLWRGKNLFLDTHLNHYGIMKKGVITTYKYSEL